LTVYDPRITAASERRERKRGAHEHRPPRVAVARGLANKPPIIPADEPTKPLDSERALAVVKILNRLAQEFQTVIMVVTHDEKVIPPFKRIYHIRDGKTHEEAGEGRQS
jgi:putative ABC transport system ATP-binding protein